MENREEILKRNVESLAKCNVKYNITEQVILNAMQEYADQQTKALTNEIERYKKIIAQPDWNEYNKQKPFNAGLYLCYTNDEQIMVCFLSANGWWSKVPDASFYGDMGNKIVLNSKEVEREVTHWMPLPNKPKTN